jgi:hypothetical protein
MNEYHKIQTVYLRDPETKFKTLLEGQYALPEFEFLANNEWVWTEKVDGTNIRIIIAEQITFGGRTDNAQLPSRLVERLQEIFLPQEETLRELFPDGACLYGEGYGGKIQKGSRYGMEQDFVLFDVNVGGLWLQRYGAVEVADYIGLDIVPTIGTGTLYEMIEKTRPGFKSLWGNFIAEGIVARPKTELQSRRGHRIITKIKCRDFGVES